MLKVAFVAVMVGVGTVLCAHVAAEEGNDQPAALEFKMKSLAGKEIDLSSYRGKVVLIVNVASECGLTPQYEQLQALHDKYVDDGLAILGFPCNQFGKQEPGSASEIQEFCRVNYGVKFKMFEKVEVNGDGACDLYKHLTGLDTKPKGKGKVSWNFEKFLLDRKGEVIGRFEPSAKPDTPEIIAQIQGALGK